MMKIPTLTPRGQEVMDYVTARTGGQSTVKRLTRDNPQFDPDIGGFVGSMTHLQFI